jgi:uroporphyrinogen-III synthase
MTVGITADRRRDEQAELLRRLGAQVQHGPTVRTLPLAHEEGVADATRTLIARPPDLVVANTGMGMRGWFAVAESLGLDDALSAALRDCEIVARGPKAAGAVLGADLDVTWRAPSEQGREMLDHLLSSGVAGRRIAVQRDGGPEPIMASALRDAGADVIDVPIYRWIEPEDDAPAMRLIDSVIAGRLDAVTFTSSPAIWNAMAMAERSGRRDALLSALNTQVAVACVGPVCSSSARAIGIEQVVEPRRGRLGAMVAALAGACGRRRRAVMLSGRRAVLQGGLLTVDDQQVELTDRERALVEALTEKPGMVISKHELARRCWVGAPADLHTVEVTVGRLRRRLGTVAELQTVPRRGYRIVP